MDNNSLSHTTWNCKYHMVFCTKIQKKDYVDPFMGNPVNKSKKK